MGNTEDRPIRLVVSPQAYDRTVAGRRHFRESVGRSSKDHNRSRTRDAGGFKVGVNVLKVGVTAEANVDIERENETSRSAAEHREIERDEAFQQQLADPRWQETSLRILPGTHDTIRTIGSLLNITASFENRTQGCQLANVSESCLALVVQRSGQSTALKAIALEHFPYISPASLLNPQDDLADLLLTAQQTQRRMRAEIEDAAPAEVEDAAPAEVEDATTIVDGDHVFLQAHTARKIGVDQQGGLFTTMLAQGWERLEMDKQDKWSDRALRDGDRVFIRAHTGKYIGVTWEKNFYAHEGRDTQDPAQQFWLSFTVEKKDITYGPTREKICHGDQIYLRSHKGYIGVEDDEDAQHEKRYGKKPTHLGNRLRCEVFTISKAP